MQIPLFKPQTEWLPPENFPDLSKYDEIAIDLETKDPDLMKMGSGSVVGKGDVVGIAVAVPGWSGYYPIAHEGGGNMSRAKVLKWFQGVLNTAVLNDTPAKQKMKVIYIKLQKIGVLTPRQKCINYLPFMLALMQKKMQK
jgi:hypothetical protein